MKDYRRKWNNRENKRTRYNPAAASQGEGRQTVARRGQGRPTGRRQQQGQRNITQYFGRMQSRNHKIRMKKVTYPSGASMNMPLL